MIILNGLIFLLMTFTNIVQYTGSLDVERPSVNLYAS